MSVKLVALLLAIAGAFVSAGICMQGDAWSSAGLMILVAVSIGGGLVAQTPSGRTMSTSV